MALSPAPGDLILHCLRIRGPAAAEPALRRELESLDWPETAHGGWIFIRELQAAAPPRRMGRALSAEVRRLAQSGNGGEVVRFDSLAELLAALLEDLAAGTAGGRWYWRRWSHLAVRPRSSALASLMAEHVLELPSVCARLAGRGALTTVWRTLGRADARQVVAELSYRDGLPLPVELALTNAPPGTGPASVRVPPQLVARWRPVLTGFARQDERRLLALLLMAREATPLRLRQAPVHLLAVLDSALPAGDEPSPESLAGISALPAVPASGRPPGLATTRTAESTATTGLKSRPNPDSSAPPGNRLGNFPAPAATPRAAAELPPGDARGPLTPGRSGTGSALPTPTRRRADPGSGVPPPPGPHRLAGAQPSGTPQASEAWSPGKSDSSSWTDGPEPPGHGICEAADFQRFHTDRGGLFYLLNFLNRPETLGLMETHGTQLDNGWAWLLRMGLELGLEPADPATRFLAEQLGLSPDTDPKDLPVLPLRDELLSLANAWYGTAGIWEPGLLRLTADVHASPSHMDVYAPLAEVRLEVRLAGLDLNPGWLPWLGRVVTFHYQD